MMTSATTTSKGPYSRTWVTITALVCMAFGFYVAFGQKRLPEGPADTIFWIGTAVCGLLFIIFLVIPTIRRLLRH